MRGHPSVLKSMVAASPEPVPQSGLTANVISVSLVLVIPMVASLAMVGYRKHRTVVRQRQINLLNRIWQLNSSQKQS